MSEPLNPLPAASSADTAQPADQSGTGIDRRSFLAQLSLAMGALAFGVSETAKADSPPAGSFTYNLTTPNILVIMVDQLRYRELAAGTPSLTGVLPNITALQAKSVEFSQFFVAGTTCTLERVQHGILKVLS